MKKFEAHINYTEIIKDNNWLNDDFRPCVIYMETDIYTRSIKSCLTQCQIDHLAFMFYQDGVKAFDEIEKQAKEYEIQNSTVDLVLDHKEFLDELIEG